MQQNHSLDANSSSASQNLPTFCWTQRFITEPNQTIPHHSCYLLEIYFNIILPSTLRSS